MFSGPHKQVPAVPHVARQERWILRIIAMGLGAGLIFSPVCVSSASAFELFGFKFGGASDDAAQAADDIPDPVSYEVTLKSADPSMVEALESASVLIGKQETPVSGTTGLLLRARNDHKRLIAALYRQGRYAGTVDILVNGQRYDKVPLDADLLANGQAQVEIDVTPGRLFAFSQPKVILTDGGEISLAEYGLVAGGPARSQLVLDAETSIISDLQKQGYALAQISDRSLEADHKTGLLDVVLEVDRGPLARLGAVSVTGAQDVDADFIAEQADIPVGETYSPEAVARANRNLRALGVFDSVIVKPSDTVLPDGSLPIGIEVKERKFKTLGAGVTVGNLDGIGLEGYWINRNLFGRAESLRVEGEIGHIGQRAVQALDYKANVIFAKPGVLGPASVFDAKLSIGFTNPEAFEKRSVGGEIGVSYQWSDVLSSRVGLDVEYARVKDNSGTNTNLLVSTPIALTYDARDNKLDPTEGFYALIEAEPTISGDGSVSFFKSSATVTAYQALDKDKRFVLAGKLSGGTIVGASKSDIPSDRRFFAGGGGSIRGYAFQAVGPRDASNDPTGGRSYVLASLEARVKVTDSLGLAAFVDSGNVYDAMSPKFGGGWYTGVGAGVRYLTPIGPLRLDVAVPLKKISGEPNYGVYLGLGQAF